MNNNGFIDYYELLQLSSNADNDTIERVFRHLAKKFHPDNKESGDIERFHQIVEAHRTLSNPESRAGYDLKYQDYWNAKWKVASEASKRTAFGNDQENREGILSMLYVQRRRDMKKPGLGDYDVSRLLGIPLELLDFHVWYLKAKGWVERLDTGYLAITALGVDQVEQGRLHLRDDRMLKSGDTAPDGDEEITAHSITGDLPEFPTDTELSQ